MSKLLKIPSGHRAKWVVLAVWLLALFGASAAQLPAKFADAERNDSASYLPGDAESTKALDATEEIQGAENVTMVIVYRRDGGLTRADRARIAADRAELQALSLPATGDFSRPRISPDGSSAIVVADIATDGEAETIRGPVEEVRGKVSGDRGGLQVRVTGSAGYSADAIKVFESINGTLLLAAVILLLFLLALIYRSPVFIWIPLFAVGAAELTSRAVGYALTEAGVTVNGQSSSILSLLVLGAGTDYGLLLVARYREELRREPDKHSALATALTATGPAIIASGLTVMLALICLSIAEVNGTAGLGPIGALGIAIAMVSMLTLLPALLAITGRRAFWPRIPHVGDSGTDVMHGGWRRWGDAIARRPRPIWIGSAVVLLVMTAGLASFSTGLTQSNQFRDSVEAVEGQALLAKAFPSGANAPTDIVVPAGRDVAKVQRAVADLPGVASTRRVAEGSPGVYLQATLERDPYSTAAYDLIPEIRRAAKSAGGETTLVGGATAIERDLRAASERDNRKIIPLVLAVVFLILVVLLRAIAAPLLLIASVILSFAAALGVSAVVYDVAFGFPGSDPSLPLFAFVFLVALGIDFNIFLMARVREEALSYGTRRGVVRGLAVTGGVITSAGIVLAGTFMILALLPLVFLTEIGFAIAFGVLLDTFLVRSTLVPALALDIGPKIWWPSRLAHEGEAGETRAARPRRARRRTELPEPAGVG